MKKIVAVAFAVLMFASVSVPAFSAIGSSYYKCTICEVNVFFLDEDSYNQHNKDVHGYDDNKYVHGYDVGIGHIIYEYEDFNGCCCCN